MFRIRTNVVKGVIIMSCSLLSTAWAENITIENRYMKEIVDDSLYKSVMFSRHGGTYDTFENQQSRAAMAALFKEYGFKSFRYHSPSISFWNYPLQLWNKFICDTYSKSNYDYVIPDQEFVKWLHDNNFKAAIQVNIRLYYDPAKKQLFRLDQHPEYIQAAAQYNAEFVRWVKDNGYGKNVLYWELGNESYNPELIVDGSQMVGLTPDEAAKVDVAFIKAFRKVDSSIKIAVDGQSPGHPRKVKMKNWSGSVGEWHRQFLTELVKLGVKDGDIDFLSQHCYAHWIDDVPFDYPRQTPPSPDKAWKLFKQPIVTQIGSVDANAALLKSLGLNHVKVQVNEFKRGASHMWYNRTMMHALAQADPLFYFIKNPDVGGAVIHDAFNNGGMDLSDAPWKSHTLGWAIFIPTTKGEYIASPIAVMYQLIDKLLTGNDKILKITGGSASVAAYGNNTLKFIVVNKEDNAVAALINLKGFDLSENAVAKIYTLTAENLTDFPVHPITKKRINFKPVESQLNVTSTSFDYTLPKYSFVLFIISGVKMNPAKKISFGDKAENTESKDDANDFYSPAKRVK